MSNIQQLQETISYEHKGVLIYMHLDYQRGLVSIQDKDGKDKRFLFKDRTTQYLGGWLLIFEALTEATKYADIRLKEQLDVKADIVLKSYGYELNSDGYVVEKSKQ